MQETFSSLLRDRAHWEFEIFLMALFDGLIVGILWPFLYKHWKHHADRDRRETLPSLFASRLRRDFYNIDGCVSGRFIHDWSLSHPDHVADPRFAATADLWPGPPPYDGELSAVVNGGPNAIRHQGK